MKVTGTQPSSVVVAQKSPKTDDTVTALISALTTSLTPKTEQAQPAELAHANTDSVQNADQVMSTLEDQLAAFTSNPQFTPHAPTHHAQLLRHFTPCTSTHLGLEPICDHGGAHTLSVNTTTHSLPIYFAFGMPDTYFLCAVTLVCICVCALGVNWR